MASRRMFSIKIVGSDAFLEMPTSCRELYFQLGMYADDDGFVNPRKIMRMIGSSDDDLKVLAQKRFVLVLENGVIVIKHWRVNNMIRKDFYQPTEYREEAARLFIKENKVYTDNPKTPGIVNNLSPQYSIGKYRLDKSTSKPSAIEEPKKPITPERLAELSASVHALGAEKRI